MPRFGPHCMASTM